MVYWFYMSRPPRIDIGTHLYHVINRANARMTIFKKEKDYHAFENVLTEAVERINMRLLAYCIMPNHWHMVLRPRKDGDLALFMQWLTVAHTQRWHAAHRTVGTGHLYQGRYKSFLVQKEDYFHKVCIYVEQNPLRAKLVKRAEDWKWSSLWRREKGTKEQQALLSPWPEKIPREYLAWVNTLPKKQELDEMRYSIIRGKPYGGIEWTERMIKKFGLEATVRKRGRPRKGT